MSDIIKVTRLTKSYGEKKVVNSIDFSVKKGSLFSFLGTNGAGKSTTINMICTFTSKTSGDVIIGDFKLGEHNREIRKMIGVVYQQNVLDHQLTVIENLSIRASLYNLKKTVFNSRLKQIAEMFEFTPLLNQKFGDLSGGQKRRIEIARAIIHEPEILLLDEPTTGLDPKSRKQVWLFINRLKKDRGMTIFLTTHYLEEATNSDDIAIISNGNIIARGTAHELQTHYSSDRLFLYYDQCDKKLLEQKLNSNHIIYEEGLDFFKINVKNQTEVREILALTEGVFESFELIKGSLDDAFINVLDIYEAGKGND